MIPVTNHPLPVGSAVFFTPSAPAPSVATRVPGLTPGRFVMIQGFVRRAFGTIEAVEEEPTFDQDSLRLQRIFYVIRRSDGERERLPAVRVGRASLLDVIAQAAK